MGSRCARCLLRLSFLLAISAPLIAQAPKPPVRIEHAWIRWLPTDVPQAGYATLDNVSDRPEILTGASSTAFGEIAVHRTVMRDGTLSMIPADRIALAPHTALDFAAGGYHMMLMRPTQPLHPGDRVPITLHFASGASVTAPFEVRARE
jgi:copper(I)-binding protein